MVAFNREYFEDDLYFLIKEDKRGYTLYYSISDNIQEARKKEKSFKVKPSKIFELRKYLDKLKHQKKNKKQIKKDLEEFVDGDGNFLNSNIPILDPAISPTKTTDQSIAMSRITNDPITRGYRTYYGEGIEETDMSKAFGYEETKDMDGKETYEFLKNKMDLSDEEAKERTKEFGKDYTGKKDDKSKMKKSKNFITRGTLSEIEKQKALKMVEDVLTQKKNRNDVIKKESNKPSSILMKNIKAIISQADKEGINKDELMKIISNE